MSGSFFYMLQWNPVTVKLTKPWTPEIFMECYCVARNKPIGREITKPQTATVISLWFWGLLACRKLYCDWQVHNHPRRPRGNQSGRDKRLDESFQVRANFRPYMKTFVAPFLSTRLPAPGSPRMVHNQHSCKFSGVHVFLSLTVIRTL